MFIHDPKTGTLWLKAERFDASRAARIVAQEKMTETKTDKMGDMKDKKGEWKEKKGDMKKKKMDMKEKKMKKKEMKVKTMMKPKK